MKRHEKVGLFWLTVTIVSALISQSVSWPASAVFYLFALGALVMIVRTS